MKLICILSLFFLNALSNYASNKDDKLLRLIELENEQQLEVSEEKVTALLNIISINIHDDHRANLYAENVREYFSKYGAINSFLIPALKDLSIYMKSGDIVSANILSSAMGTMSPKIGEHLRDVYQLSGNIVEFVSFANRLSELSLADLEDGTDNSGANYSSNYGEKLRAYQCQPPMVSQLLTNPSR